MSSVSAWKVPTRLPRMSAKLLMPCCPTMIRPWMPLPDTTENDGERVYAAIALV